jgi:hypothetical protein
VTLTGVPSAGRARVRGHGLKADGSPFTADGEPIYNPVKYGAGVGRGRCQCGVQSEDLSSAAERKEWHAGHLAQLRAEGKA